MLKRVPLCALIATMILCRMAQAAPAPKKPANPVEQAFTKAVQAQQAGKLDEALAGYKAVLKMNPGVSPCYLNMALIYTDKKNYDAAIPLYLKFEKMMPNDPMAPTQLARLYFAVKRDTANAAKQAKMAIKLKAKEPVLYYIAGMSLVQEKDYKGAVTYLKTYITLQPKDDRAKESLAMCYLQTKQFGLALKQYESLIASNPNNLGFRKNAVIAAQSMGDQKTAAKHLDYIRQHDPNDVSATLAVARNYELKQDYKKAISLLEDVLKRDKKNYVATFNLGRLAFVTKDFKTAKSRFTESNAIAGGKDLPSLLNIAISENQLGNKDAAADKYEAALKVDPKNMLALQGIAGIYAEKGQTLKAAEYMKRIAAQTPKDPGAAVQVAGLYSAAGENAKAVAMLNDLAKKFPGSLLVRAALADTYVRMNRQDDAIAIYRKLATAPKQNLAKEGISSPAVAIAQIYLSQQKLKEAVAEYRKAIAKDTKDLALRDGLVSVLEQSKSYDEAIDALKGMLAIQPNTPAIYQRIAGVYRTKLDGKMALATLEDAVKKCPKDRPLMESLANAYREQKNYDKAIATWRTIGTKFPDKADDSTPASMRQAQPVDMIASLYTEQEKYKEALAEYEPLLKTKPKDAYRGMAGVYTRQKDYKSAIEQWEKFRALDPKAEDSYLAIANIYSQQAKDDPSAYDKGAEELRVLLKKDPKNRRAFYGLVTNYREAKKYDEALKELQDFMKAYPDDAKSMGADAQIPVVLTEAGKYDEALKIYSENLKKDPKDQAASQGIMAVYTAKKDPEPQASAWRKVLEIAPGNVEIRVQLADYYAQRSQYDLAIKEYVEVLKSTPGDAKTVSSLASAYENSNNRDEAIQQYRAAAKLDPGYYSDVARLLTAAGKAEDAKKEIQDAIKATPKVAKLHTALAAIYQSGGKAEDAAAEYRTAIKEDPTNSDASDSLIAMYETSSKFDEAAAEYKRRIAADPKTAALIRQRLARMLVNNNKLDAAVQVYSEMAANESSKMDGQRGLAEVYMKQGNKAKAEEQYKAVLSESPGMMDAIDGLEKIYKEENKQDQFLSYMKDLLKNAKAGAPYDNFMSKFKAAGKTDDGLAYLDTLQAERPEDVALTLCRARWNVDAGKGDKGVEIYKKAIADAKSDPGPGAYLGLADLCEKAGKTDDAIDAYSKCIDKVGSPDVRLKYGALLEKANKKTEAIEQYKAVLKADPANAQASGALTRLGAAAP